MTDVSDGYRLYWRRMSLHIGLSEAAKHLGNVRGSQLSAYERGLDHDLTEEQIAAYEEYLYSKEPEILPEVTDTEDEVV